MKLGITLKNCKIMNSLNLSTGISNFRELISEGNYFVDKSLFIKDIISDRAKIILITRPRRFGKTLNLSILEHFFAKEVDNEETKSLFDNLAISRHGEEYLSHQGKYPVIFISFKEVKHRKFELAYQQIASLLAEVYRKYYYLTKSNQLIGPDKIKFENIINRQADYIDLTESIKDLCYYLYLHHKVRPILLIDEYDTPMQSGYINKYYDEIVDFFRVFLGFSLKDNRYLTKGVLTGILRVSKESLFSGLNNLETYSVLNDKYSSYFGFTEEEVKKLIKLSGLNLNYEIVKEWYNGYK